MTFKEKLKEIRKIIFEENKSTNVQFNNEKEKIIREKIYSIHYLYFSNYRVKEIRDVRFFNFMLPDNLSEDDAFKIISYCFDHTGHPFGSYECCTTAVSSLQNWKIFPISYVTDEQDCQIIDLLSVISTDDGTMFKNSTYYKEYIKWYKPNVSYEEFSEICYYHMTNPKRINLK